MDQELKQTLEGIASNVATGLHEGRDTRALLVSHVDTDAANHETVRQELAVVRGHVALLYKKTYGSEPPPPPPPSSHNGNGKDHSDELLSRVHGPPLDEVAEAAIAKGSHNSLEMAALEGRMIGNFQRLEARVAEIAEMTRAQNRDWGIKLPNDAKNDKKEPFFLATKEGQRFTLRLVTAIGALIAAVGTMFAAYHGQHPAPSPSAPGPHPALSATPSPTPPPVTAPVLPAPAPTAAR